MLHDCIIKSLSFERFFLEIFMKLHPSVNPVCLQFYLAKQEKDDFRKVCFQRDTTMSREIRRMIREYVNAEYIESRLYYAVKPDQ
jgi:hypothetical protein